MNKIDYDCCNYCCCLNTDECPCHPSDDIKDEFVCDFHIPNYEKVVQEARFDAIDECIAVLESANSWNYKIIAKLEQLKSQDT